MFNTEISMFYDSSFRILHYLFFLYLFLLVLVLYMLRVLFRFALLGPMSETYCDPVFEIIQNVTHRGVHATFLDQRGFLNGTFGPACCGHPSSAVDQAMAQNGAKVIGNVMEWKQESVTSPIADLKAPENFIIKFATDIDGIGNIAVNITREWAPLGVDHLYALVNDQFYDGAAFFRVVGGFVLQFGIAGTPAKKIKWKNSIKDDPVLKSNVKYTISYATAGPNTRTTQLFFNYKDNTELDSQGFAPLGIAISGTEYLDRVYDPTPGDPNGVNQTEYETKGDTWIRSTYPEINFIKHATIVVN